MTRADTTLDKVLAWATGDPNVRRLLLVGSRARTPPPDDLADVDVQVYAERIDPYTRDHAWLSAIGPIWVCVPDHYPDGDLQVPTRLVVFDGGVKVDFAFYPARHASSGIRAGLPHRVLLDKGESQPDSPAPGVPAEPAGPTAQAFSRVVEEFWFEAYHVATYLARNELWLAKSRDWATKQFLMTMIDWHEQVVRGRAQAPGGGIRERVSPDTWDVLHLTFSAFGAEESWSAALATITLFRRLATDVAAAAGLPYPVDMDGAVSRYIHGLREVRGDAGG